MFCSFTGAVCFLISYALGALLVYLIFKFKCRILQIVFKSIVRYEDSHFTADINQVFNVSILDLYVDIR